MPPPSPDTFRAAGFLVLETDGMWFVGAGAKNLGSFNPQTKSVYAPGFAFGVAETVRDALVVFKATRAGKPPPAGVLRPHPRTEPGTRRKAVKKKRAA